MAIATVAVVVALVGDRLDELDDVDLRFRPLWMVLALAPSVAAGVVLPLAWRALVLAWHQRLGRAAAVRIWVLAQTTRYLPTGLFAVASRLTLAGDAGVARGVAATTFLVEAMYLALWSGLLGAALVPSAVVPAPWRAAGVVGCGAGLVLAGPALGWAATAAGQRGGRLARWAGSLGGAPDVAAMWRASSLFGLNALLRVVASVLVARSVLGLDLGAPFSDAGSEAAGDVLAVAGAVAIAVVLGLVGVTPAGLGVREGVIAALLADRFGLGDAAALAVVLRAYELAVELAFVGVAVVIGRRSPGRTPREDPG